MRPLRVAMRARKPCVRLRLRLLGWKVLFMVAVPVFRRLAPEVFERGRNSSEVSVLRQTVTRLRGWEYFDSRKQYAREVRIADGRVDKLAPRSLLWIACTVELVSVAKSSAWAWKKLCTDDRDDPGCRRIARSAGEQGTSDTHELRI